MRKEYKSKKLYRLELPITGWNPFSRLLIFILSCICTFSVYTSPVFANPQVDQVTSGDVSIQQTPNTTTINQTSQSAIINWQSFNIGKEESTHFQQPAGGITLNRISPTQGASQIYGYLTATGQIILINPAGIYFSPSAIVNGIKIF
jgi:filamentous hemagglutinin family protein